MAYQDPASEESQKELEDALEAIGIAVGVSSLLIISNALERITEDTTISEALAMSGADMEAFKEIVQQGRTDYAKIIKGMYNDLAVNNDEWAKVFYEHSNVKQIPAVEHPKMNKILTKGEKNALKTVEAACNTSVVGLVDRYGAFVPFSDGYRSIITNSITAMQMGESTYTTEIKRVCKDLSKKGLRVQYESGARRELFGAVRTNIMDGYRDTMMRVRDVQGEEFGADGYEISAHSMCAPDHLDYEGEPLQGGQFTNKEFEEIQSDLARPIETGANCRHMTYKIIMNVTKPAHSRAQLDQYRAYSNGMVSFQGMSGKQLTMSGYDATQYQRRIEQNIRALKTESKLLDSAGLPAFAKVASKDARDYTAYYMAMSEETGLKTRLERTRAYVLN